MTATPGGGAAGTPIHDAAPGAAQDPRAAEPEGADVLGRAEVVLVSYKSANHVAELLAAWPDPLRVAVVDNAGGADGLDRP